MNLEKYILPNWDAPAQIQAMTTTRAMPLDALEQPLSWLTQVHGNQLVELTHLDSSLPEADGSYTQQPQVVCVVKTADCVPVLLTNRRGDFVAALHCGWRGLHADLIAKAVEQAPQDSELLAWIGPAISQACYEVDAAFQQRFCNKNPAYTAAFQVHGDKYLANLPWIAEQQLRHAGVPAIYQSGICSFLESEKCHSFRRDSVKAGRMATLIWIDRL